MSTKRIVGRVASLLGALATLSISAGVLSAQVSPKPRTDTSTKRIKVQKEVSGGEVALPPCASLNVDSIQQAGADKIAGVMQRVRRQLADQSRVDSIALAGQSALDDLDARNRLLAQRERLTRESEVAVLAARRETADSIERAQALQLALETARGVYAGIAGGSSTPLADARTNFVSGFNVMMPMGWDATEFPFGVRSDLSFDRLGGRALRDANGMVLANSGDIDVYSFNVDAKLRLRAPGKPSRTYLYLLGGVGAHRVAGATVGTLNLPATTFSSATTRFGWNAGAGAAFGWGSTEMFIETRYVNVTSDLAFAINSGVGKYTAFMPLVIGFQRF